MLLRNNNWLNSPINRCQQSWVTAEHALRLQPDLLTIRSAWTAAHTMQNAISTVYGAQGTRGLCAAGLSAAAGCAAPGGADVAGLLLLGCAASCSCWRHILVGHLERGTWQS